MAIEPVVKAYFFYLIHRLECHAVPAKGKNSCAVVNHRVSLCRGDPGLDRTDVWSMVYMLLFVAVKNRSRLCFTGVKFS